MVTQNTSQLQQVVSRLIAMAWFDGEFYNRLSSNAAEVLREAGVLLDGVADVIVKHDSEVPGKARCGRRRLRTLPVSPPCRDCRRAP